MGREGRGRERARNGSECCLGYQINAHLTNKIVKYAVYFQDQHVQLPYGNTNAIDDGVSDVVQEPFNNVRLGGSTQTNWTH